jgi:CHASE1-domain containing sensor protein
VSEPTQPSWGEQRVALCRELQAQRERIALQLGPGASAQSGYPRSMTMRLLGQRPGTLFSLAASLIAMFRARH